MIHEIQITEDTQSPVRASSIPTGTYFMGNIKGFDGPFLRTTTKIVRLKTGTDWDLNSLGMETPGIQNYRPLPDNFTMVFSRS